MEKIGLIDKFFNASNANWEASALLNGSKEQQTLSMSLLDTLKILKEIAKSQNIQIIIKVEKLALMLELENHGNSPEERNSIHTALQQLEEAQKSFIVVNDSAAYCAVAETYSSKRKEGGLPLDSFREFLKSHTTRLTNRLASPLSGPEKNILRQRKENLKIVKALYSELQANALGLLPKTKGHEIER